MTEVLLENKKKSEPMKQAVKDIEELRQEEKNYARVCPHHPILLFVYCVCMFLVLIDLFVCVSSMLSDGHVLSFRFPPKQSLTQL
jgi:hypothetical protein